MTDDNSIVDIVTRATRGSAGYDIIAEEDFVVEPGVDTTTTSTIKFGPNTRVIVTAYNNVAVGGQACGGSYNPDFYGMVDKQYELETKTWFALACMRSGLAFEYGLRFKNAIGIIDQDTTQPLRFVMTSDKRIEIKKGERFAQIVPIVCGRFAGEREPTRVRGGGYGHTGRQ